MKKRLVEIRSYKLKPGSRAAFHAAAVSAAVPLLHKWGWTWSPSGRRRMIRTPTS